MWKFLFVIGCFFMAAWGFEAPTNTFLKGMALMNLCMGFLALKDLTEKE